MSRTQSCRKDDHYSIKKPVSLYIGLWSNSLWFYCLSAQTTQSLSPLLATKTAQLMRQIPEQPKRELLVISKNSGGELLQASPLTLS